MFLGDIIEPEGVGDYIELNDGYVIRKAVDGEIDDIKHQMENFGDSEWMTNRAEARVDVDEEGTPSLNYLTREFWNYWLVENIDSNEISKPFEIALSLCRQDLSLLFRITYQNGEWTETSMRYSIYYNFLYDYGDWEKWGIRKSFSKNDIEEIKQIYNLIQEFTVKEGDYPYIKKSLDDFSMLKVVPRETPFFYVSMFSIIESLLVHNPTDSDKGITHQLATKLNLLNKRFEYPLVLQDYFKNPATFEKTIKKLYNYRSAIAHGDFANFQKDLQTIESKEKATKFIYKLLKNVIIQSLKEPDLISDLKDC